MKKYILFPATLLAGILTSSSLLAQENDQSIKKEKSQEIIIRKNGDKEEKINVEVNGDSVLVNGKPLSEFHDGDVSIIDNDEWNNGSNNFSFAPGNPGFENLRVLGDEKPHTFLGVVSDKANGGVKITEVVKGSAAENSGLLKGDIITKIDDKIIGTPDDLMKIVRSHKPKDEIKIYYTRDGKSKDAKIKLGESSANKAFYFKNFNQGPDVRAFNFNGPSPKVFSSPGNLYNFSYRLNRPKLGLKIEDTENSNGAKILNIEEGSPADKAGLKKDDIITEVNGEKVSGVEDATDLMGDAEEGETLSVKALRNNSEMKFDVKIPKKLNQANL